MKRLTLCFFSLAICSINVFAQTDSIQHGKDSIANSTIVPKKVDIEIEKVTIGIPKVKFTETTHDFGNVKQSIAVSCEFEYTNTGTAVIAIEDVQRGCGCTTPEWTREPVYPGAKGKIKAIYQGSETGDFSKSVTVKFTNGDLVFLTLKGTVEETSYKPSGREFVPDH